MKIIIFLLINMSLVFPAHAKLAKYKSNNKPYYIFGKIQRVKKTKLLFHTERDKYVLKYQDVFLDNQSVLKRKKNKNAVVKLKIKPSYVISRSPEKHKWER